MADLPCRPMPSQSRSRERVDAVCSAALQLLRRGGIAECTVAAVAAEAGITPASVYRYFPNIDAILHAVATRQLDETHERLSAALDELTSREHALDVLVALLADYELRFRDDAAMRALWAGTLALDALIELNVADSRRNGELIAARISPFLRRPLDPHRAFLVTCLIGAGTVLLLQVDDDEAEAMRAPLRAMLVALFDDDATPDDR